MPTTDETGERPMEVTAQLLPPTVEDVNEDESEEEFIVRGTGMAAEVFTTGISDLAATTTRPVEEEGPATEETPGEEGTVPTSMKGS
jgi:hypothetical protein